MVNKKYFLGPLAMLLAVIVASSLTSAPEVLAVSSSDRGVVEKLAGEAFTVRLEFKNTGSGEGVWSVNVAFEGNYWFWAGSKQTLTLKAQETKTLSWAGNVPANAPSDTVGRLIVYYNESYKPLDWWIHVFCSPELSVSSSKVW